ncbi:MAG: hypothetical protein ACEQSR_00965 [Candidatus Methylacidiphilales bacterium]
MEDEFYYSDLNKNFLLHLLKQADFAASLAYLVNFKSYADLTVTPYKHSIQISNSEITIAVVLYVGFETNEYLQLKNKANVHFISVSKVIPEMCEFEEMHIKFIDKLSWFFSVINRCENELVKEINWIKNLTV